MNDRQTGRVEGYIKGLNFAMGVIQTYPTMDPNIRKLLQYLESVIHTEYVRITK